MDEFNNVKKDILAIFEYGISLQEQLKQMGQSIRQSMEAEFDLLSTSSAKLRQKRTFVASIPEDEELPDEPENEPKRQCSQESYTDTKVRSSRAAARNASNKISKIAAQKANEKLRRPCDMDIKPVIHARALRETYAKSSVTNEVYDSHSELVIKQEKLDDAPTRSTRTKTQKLNEVPVPARLLSIKTESKKNSSVANSDVIEIQVTKQSLIELSDTENDDSECITSEKNGNSYNKKSSLVEKSMSETTEKQSLKQKENQEIVTNGETETLIENSIYEDAEGAKLSDGTFNATYSVPGKSNKSQLKNGSIKENNVNATFAIPKNIINSKLQPDTKVPNASLLTDDDSEDDLKLTKQPVVKILRTLNLPNLKNEPLFSPKDNVKKRVEALELNFAAGSENTFPVLTPRVTRTKTRAIAAAAAGADDTQVTKTLKESAIPKYPASVLNALLPSTNSAKNRTKPATRANNIITNVDSFISNSTSSLKSNRHDARDIYDDDRRRKEEEALNKKNAMIAAKVEEQRQKRQLKVQKVQNARAALERERQIQLEKLEREKEEKQKLLRAEREDAVKKGAIRKKNFAQARVQETEDRRKAEDTAKQQRLQELELEDRRAATQRLKEQEELDNLKKLQEKTEQLRAKARAEKLAALKAKRQNQKPVVAKVVATATTLDLDTDASSEDESNPKRPIPDWSKETIMEHSRIQNCIPNNLTDQLFLSKPISINLEDLFNNIDERALRRNSSAVWRTPPRYSQIPKY